MNRLWLPLVALVVCLIAGPIVRRAAVRLNLFDRPDAGLKPHEKPIPYLGGVAIFLGWFAGMIFAWQTDMLTAPQARAVVAAISILMLTGLIDDVRHLPPKLRLAIQLASPIVLIFVGVGADAVTALTTEFVARPETDHTTLLRIAAFAFAAVVFAGATNATNLIDGLDGLCAGTLGISALGFALLFLREDGGTPGGAIGIAAALCMLGACIGFLFFNFNPASMFMGDSGSLALGGMAGLSIVLSAEHASWRGFIAALLIFGFPIYDAALAITRRRLNRRPLFIGDRSHFYDQLRDRGLSVRQTVLRCYLLAFLLVAAGHLVMFLPFVWLIVVAVVLPVAALVASAKAGLLRVDDSAARSAER